MTTSSDARDRGSTRARASDAGRGRALRGDAGERDRDDRADERRASSRAVPVRRTTCAERRTRSAQFVIGVEPVEVELDALERGRPTELDEDRDRARRSRRRSTTGAIAAVMNVVERARGESDRGAPPSAASAASRVSVAQRAERWSRRTRSARSRRRRTSPPRPHRATTRCSPRLRNSLDPLRRRLLGASAGRPRARYQQPLCPR